MGNGKWDGISFGFSKLVRLKKGVIIARLKKHMATLKSFAQQISN